MEETVIMGYLKTKEAKKQLVLTYIAFSLNGMLVLSIGSLMPFIREARGLSYAFVGAAVSMHSVGNLVSSFAAGTVAVLWGKKKSILLFNAFYAFSYILIVFGGSNAAVMIAFFSMGLARGATSNFANTMINNLAPGNAVILNALHAMFSIGAFLFPIFVMILTRTDASRWIYACYFMITMGIVSWILYFSTPVHEAPKEKKEAKSNESKWGFFREPLFYLCTLTLFFYLCAEQGVIGWLVTYFSDTGLLDPSLSQLMASVQWFMVLTGRLSAAKAAQKVSKEKLLLVMGIGTCISFFWLLFSKSTVPIVIGIMGFGLSMAGIYATTVSFCGNLIQKYSMAWSFILTLASFGAIIMPMIIGRIAEHAGILYGMSSVAAAVMINLGLIVGLGRYVRRNRQ